MHQLAYSDIMPSSGTISDFFLVPIPKIFHSFGASSRLTTEGYEHKTGTAKYTKLHAEVAAYGGV